MSSPFLSKMIGPRPFPTSVGSMTAQSMREELKKADLTTAAFIAEAAATQDRQKVLLESGESWLSEIPIT